MLKNWFKFCYDIHHYSTTSSMKVHLHKKPFRTNNFGKFSVTESANDLWNKTQGQMGEIGIEDLRPSKIKCLLTDKFIKGYWLIISLLNYVHSQSIYEWVLYCSICIAPFSSTIQMPAGNWIFFHKIKVIPLVLVLLSRNCPLII